jgi:hypothetical protein
MFKTAAVITVVGMVMGAIKQRICIWKNDPLKLAQKTFEI